ncbi:MAG: transglutaminase-like domain-containing protein [Micropruina sp.]
MAQNLIAHYRFATTQLPEHSSDDINARWLSAILDIDQQRHGTPLLSPRAEAERVQGCCRDQTLIAVGVLRQHNIPARSRVGFADSLRPNTRVDHVVAEAWLDGRWIRFDPGLTAARGRVTDPQDISISGDFPFLTAAAAWSGHRQHGRSIDDLGVSIGPMEFAGSAFVLSYLIMDVAHRFRRRTAALGQLGCDAVTRHPDRFRARRRTCRVGSAGRSQQSGRRALALGEVRDRPPDSCRRRSTPILAER